MKLVWLDLLSYKNRCSLRFECFLRFKFILEYSRANFAIRIACTSPANTYLNMNPYLSFVQGVYLLLKQIALWYQPEQPEHTATLWLCGLIIYSKRLLPVITLRYREGSNLANDSLHTRSDRRSSVINWCLNADSAFVWSLSGSPSHFYLA